MEPKNQYVRQSRSFSPVQPKKRKKRKILKVTLIILAILLILLVIFGFKAYSDVKSTITKTDKLSLQTTAVNFSAKTPFSVLIVGTANVADQKNASAVIIDATVNPKTKTMTLVNFPPSAVMPDGSVLAEDYATGGLASLQKDIEGLVDTPINKAAVLDMQGVGELTQAIGGVQIDSPFYFVSDHLLFNPGTLELKTATQATAYAKPVNTADIDGYETRQQILSMAVFNNIKSFSTVWHYGDILKTLNTNLQTNVSFDEFKTIATHYYSAFSNTSKINVHTTTAIDSLGNTYDTVEQTEMDSVKTNFKKALQ